MSQTWHNVILIQSVQHCHQTFHADFCCVVTTVQLFQSFFYDLCYFPQDPSGREVLLEHLWNAHPIRVILCGTVPQCSSGGQNLPDFVASYLSYTTVKFQTLNTHNAPGVGQRRYITQEWKKKIGAEFQWSETNIVIMKE